MANQPGIDELLRKTTSEFYAVVRGFRFQSFQSQTTAGAGPLPEIVPVTTAPSQAVKRNFIRIQEEIETLLASQRPGASITAPAIAPAQVNGQAKQNGQSQHPGQSRPGESLDF